VRAILNGKASDEKRGRTTVRFNRRGKPKTEAARQLVQYCRSSVDAAVLHGVCKLSQSLQGSVARVAKQVRDVGRELDRLKDAFETLATQTQDGNVSPETPLGDLHVAVDEILQRRMPELAAQLDHKFQADFLDNQGGLRAVLTTRIYKRATLPATLRYAARSVVLAAIKEINIANLLLESQPEADDNTTDVRACLAAAVPRLLEGGGSKRLLLVLPEGSREVRLPELVERTTGVKPSVAFDSDPDVTICYEAERMSLPTVAALLVEHRPDCAEIASRLLTRVDVQWSPLAQTPTQHGSSQQNHLTSCLE
jgi:hypothetical protein